MQIAIMDDCEQDRLELRTLLCQYFKDQHLAADFIEFSTTGEFEAAFKPGLFSIAFLDIYMDEADGMDVARRIYAQDPECRLIFSTVSQTHAVDSYAVRAAYYLTKPVEYLLLKDAMDLVCEGLLRDNSYLKVSISGVEASVFLRDIIYMDCNANRTFLHLSNQSIIVDDRVSLVLSQLQNDARFLLCNRNVAVNMDYIEGITDSDFLLYGGMTVPIRTRGKKNVRKAFLEYSVKYLQRKE